MAIESGNLVKQYTRRNRTFRAVDDVSISIPEGKIVVVSGSSGSGKSTLLNILSGMIRPDEGNVLIEGKDLAGLSVRERDMLRGKKIGIVPQVQSLIGGLTVRENIVLQGTFSGKKSESSSDDVRIYAELLGIEELLDVFPNSLSGGEMKRVAVARAITGDHEYIFADEPTGELDPENAGKIMDVLRSQADSGKGVLLITHDELVESRADILYSMAGGKVTPVMTNTGDVGDSHPPLPLKSQNDLLKGEHL